MNDENQKLLRAQPEGYSNITHQYRPKAGDKIILDRENLTFQRSSDSDESVEIIDVVEKGD